LSFLVPREIGCSVTDWFIWLRTGTSVRASWFCKIEGDFCSSWSTLYDCYSESAVNIRFLNCDLLFLLTACIYYYSGKPFVEDYLSYITLVYKRERHRKSDRHFCFEWVKEYHCVIVFDLMISTPLCIIR
jgi:hypothetical protein